MLSPSPDRDVAACDALLVNGSRTFAAAARLLPRRLRASATALYAFCRVADDAIDLEGSDPSAVARLQARLDALCEGQPQPFAPDRAFAAVVRQHAIPRALPQALLEGFAWDAQGRRYEDLSALRAYAARVAGSVGAMMALLMGARSSGAVARACDLGVAMQLTNIARDVGEDARNGRLYLPLAWMREAGLDPDGFLARPRHDAALASVVARLLGAADELYEQAAAGVAMLPLGCRAGIHAARLMYAEIGHQLERKRIDCVQSRAVVPATRKIVLALAAVAATAASHPATARAAAPLAETAFLVDAVLAIPAPRDSRAARNAWWDVPARLNMVLDLFERLERRELERGLAARRSP
jgi:15-cis-phytoene synthase